MRTSSRSRTCSTRRCGRGRAPSTTPSTRCRTTRRSRIGSGSLSERTCASSPSSSTSRPSSCASGATWRASGARSSSPSGDATRSASGRSSARGARAVRSARISTTMRPRCSCSRQPTGPIRGCRPRSTPTSSPTASTRSCSTGSAATRRPLRTRKPQHSAVTRLPLWWHRGPVASVVLVVNPQATAVNDDRTERVAAALGQHVEVVRTERAGHATELVRDADADAVVVFGGDGAYNEALNGLRPELAVGFVPGGGSSVLPRALGLPRAPVAAAERIRESLRLGRTRAISLGRVNGRRFAFAAALGVPAEVVRRVDARGRAQGVRPADRIFVTTFARILAERRGRVDDVLDIEGHGRAAFALVANGDPYTYLGRVPIHLAPEARWDDGLDVVAPRAIRPLGIPRLVAATFAGRAASTRGVLYL